MALFDRDILIKSLETFSKAPKGIPNGEVNAYLRHYHLYDSASSGVYRIGRMVLDDVAVTLQLFQQRDAVISKGLVVVCHGYMDHVGLYSHLITALQQDGFDVLCYDMSGHGLSDGDPLDVDDFEHYALQLNGLIKAFAHGGNKSIHLIGQSTGGAVVCAQHLLLDNPQSLQGGKRILLAPLVRPAMWKSIRRRFRWLKYVIRRVPRRYSRSSHNHDFVTFLAENDPLQHNEIPVSWIGAMLAWGDWLEQQKPSVEPVYIIQGTEDRTVDWIHNLQVLEAVFPNNKVMTLKNARHHLVNESAQYLNPVLKFVSSVLSEP
ncbi:MAG: alpha/beta fold hydrolase [Neptuniibacter sp.]